MKEKFSEDLILALGCVDLLPQLVAVFVQLRVLRPFELRLSDVIVYWRKLLPFSSLALTLFLDAILVRPLALRLLQSGQFLLSFCIIPLLLC